jgi:hypothetical protein
VGPAKPLSLWLWSIWPPTAEFLRFALFVVVGGVVGVDFGVELLDEEEGGLFAKPVVFEEGAGAVTCGVVVFTGFFAAFFAFFFVLSAET